MMTAFRANLQVFVQLLVEHHRVARRALGPKPSGMSRFLVLDLPVPILVFLANVGCVVAIGGGVNAGSTMLTPLIDFFVNEVVSI